MRRRHARPAVLAATALAGLLAWALGPAPTPAAASGAPIEAPVGPIAYAPLSGTAPTAVVDDPVHRLVFVADGVDSIEVFDYDAIPVTTISSVGAVNGMVLHDGTIYATNSTAAIVERIDTGTLTRSSNLATGINRPRTPVVLGGDLWVASGGCDGGSGSVLVEIDLDTGAQTELVPEPLQRRCPILAGDEGHPDVLLVGESALSAPGVLRYDLSGATPVLAGTSAGISFVAEMALDPDGQYWYSASGSPYGIQRWRTSDMANLGVAFPINPYPTAVAVTAANGGFVAGGVNGIYDPDVAVFDSHDVLTKRFSHDFGTTSDVIMPNGLAFSADGSRLFTVASGGLRVFALPGVAGLVANNAGDPQPGIQVDAVDTATETVIDGAMTDANGWFSIGRAAFGSGQTYQVRYTDPLTGTSTWLGAGGLPVSQGDALTFAFSPDRGQPADLTASLVGASYHPVSPTRLVDTRSGIGVTPGTMEPWEVFAIPTAGAGGVLPDGGVSAVVLNVTAASPQSDGYLVLWPAGAEVPPTSNVNYVAGTTSPNLVTVAVGTEGLVLLGNAIGRTEVVVDLAGWFDDGATAGGTEFHPVTPHRVLDTRDGTGGFDHALGTGEAIDVMMKDNGSGVPAGNVTAVALNVTVTGTTGGGYLTVSPTGASRPTASNLNWAPGVTVPNMVIAKIAADGRLNIFNSFGRTDVVVDVVGWFDDGTTAAGPGGRFHPVTPDRVLDTREGIGAAPAPLTTSSSIDVRLGGVSGVPPSGVGAVLVNTTVTNTTGGGYLTVWPKGVARPTASNLNWVPGQTIPNLVLTPVSADGWAKVFNSFGRTDVVGDVAGWFDTP